jgi:hypothetical protein
MTSLYIDGELVQKVKAGGNCSNWDANFPLVLANELNEPADETGQRKWLGNFYLVAVYSSALTAEEVRRHFQLVNPLYNPAIEDNQLKLFLSVEVAS